MTSSVTIRNATRADFDAVIALQEANHRDRLSEQEKQQGGFVSAIYPKPVLEQSVSKTACVVAEMAGRIVGYEIALTTTQARSVPLLVPMVRQFNKVLWRGRKLTDYRIVVEGQIIVEREQRGTGLAKQLHDAFCKRLRERGFEVLATEISPQNARSLAFHTQIAGLTIADTYTAEGRQWHVLAQDI